MQQFLGACAFLIVAGGVFAGVQSGKVQAGSLADWAAAFGSAGAVLFTWWQTKKTLRAALDQKREFVTTVSDTVDISLNAIYGLRIAIRDRDPLTLVRIHSNLPYTATDALAAIVAVGVEKWPSAIFYVRVRAVEEAVRKLMAELDKGYSGVTSPNYFVTPQVIESVLTQAEADYRQSLAGLK